MEVTVLVDVCASLFAASFIILLIFLSLSQDRAIEVPSERTIEATSDLEVQRQMVLTPAAMVGILHAHRGSASGVSVDIFSDRVEIIDAQGTTVIPDGPEIESSLSVAIQSAGGGRIRFYVFANRLYNVVMQALEGAALAQAEITVPRALRDVSQPDRAWSGAFKEIDALQLSAGTFREALAQLLQGSASVEEPGSTVEVGEPFSFHATRSYTSPLDRLRAWASVFVTVVVPAMGFAAVLWIERSRFCAAYARQLILDKQRIES